MTTHFEKIPGNETAERDRWDIEILLNQWSVVKNEEQKANLMRQFLSYDKELVRASVMKRKAEAKQADKAHVFGDDTERLTGTDRASEESVSKLEELESELG
ncbi:MAG: hypothetical protein G01um101472_107 [Parcubacteria group bacterium Gr01-1014_72]|nr:MAG: hypothetical protein G01um101472_107 [Parcubacteria group bacterium Gr01-1014_72]